MKLLKHKLLLIFVTTLLLLQVAPLATANAVSFETSVPTSMTTMAAELDQPLSKDRDANDCKAKSYKELNKDNCQLVKIIVVVTQALSAIAGLVIIGMMIIGGIQYSSAGADPSKVQAAKQKITNAILALLLLVFGFSILQWLVPGGMF